MYKIKQNEGIKTKVKGFLKEYNGLVPIAGGIFTAGAVSVVAFVIGSFEHLQRMVEYGITTNDWGYAAKYLYEKGSELAGYYAFPGYLGGQFLTYKFKKALGDLVSKIIGKRRWLNWVWILVYIEFLIGSMKIEES